MNGFGSAITHLNIGIRYAPKFISYKVISSHTAQDSSDPGKALYPAKNYRTRTEMHESLQALSKF